MALVGHSSSGYSVLTPDSFLSLHMDLRVEQFLCSRRTNHPQPSRSLLKAPPLTNTCPIAPGAPIPGRCCPWLWC